MNELQRLVDDYLKDHPGETYSSIGRRGGLSKATVWAIARRETPRQTPHPETIKRLAAGMEMPEARVRDAAALAAGFGSRVSSEVKTERGRLIVEALNELDEARLDELHRRARYLLEEMRRSSGDDAQ